MSSYLRDRNFLTVNGANAFFSAYQVLFLFVPAFLFRQGLKEGAIGLVMATGVLVSVAVRPLVGYLVDRGRRVPFIAAGGLLALVTTFPWIAGSATAGAPLFGLRVAQGVAYGVFAGAAYGYVAVTSPRGRKGEAMGLFGLSFFLPTAAGGFLGEILLRRHGFDALLWACACSAFGAALLPLFLAEPKGSSGISPGKASALLSLDHVVVDGVGILFGMAYGTLYTFIPVFVAERATGSVGAFVLLYAAAVTIVRTVGQRAMARTGREGLLLVSLLLMAGGTAVVAAGTGWAIAVAGFVTGTAHGLLFPVASSLLLDRAGMRQGAMAMALFSGGMDLGIVAGAAAMGYVVEGAGYGTAFLAAAALPAIGALLFLTQDPAFRSRARRRKKAPPG
jgi:MFS family permease